MFACAQTFKFHLDIFTLYNVCAVPWGCSVPWGDIMSTVGGYLEHCGGVQYRGGYIEYRGGLSWVPWGCSVPWGISWVPWREKSFVIWVPHGTHDIPPHVSWYPPTVLKFQRMVSPTVLNTLHGTHHSPPRASWYPPRYWTPPRYSCYLPTVLNTPHGTQDTHDIPSRYWTPSTVLNTPTVLHTHYTGWYSLFVTNRFNFLFKMKNSVSLHGHPHVSCHFLLMPSL